MEHVQDYSLLNEETFNEIEEVAPLDFYFDDERFKTAAVAFSQESDFEDVFNRRTSDIKSGDVTKTIQVV